MTDTELSRALLALEECIERYAEERRAHVRAFVARHFSLAETIAIQRRSVFTDTLATPLNTLWSIPYMALKKIVESVDKMGWTKLMPLFASVPTGVRTRYQKEIEHLVVIELLEWSSGVDDRPAIGLLERIQAHSDLAAVFASKKLAPRELLALPTFAREIEQYTAGRALISDIAGSAATLVLGWWLFHDHSLGPLDLGDRMAHWLARDRAITEFALGERIGSVFYGLFPPEPSLAQAVGAVLLVGFVLALFGMAAAVLSDPLRQRLGLQERRLHALIDDLEQALLLYARKRLKTSLRSGPHA